MADIVKVFSRKDLLSDIDAAGGVDSLALFAMTLGKPLPKEVVDFLNVVVSDARAGDLFVTMRSTKNSLTVEWK